MSTETKFREDIQILRGLAVFAVLLFHAHAKYFPLGYLGVDVFFVISGFVVTPLILQIFTDKSNKGGARLASLLEFYKRRFYRLAPALAFILVISALAILLLGSPSDHERFARQGIATLLLIGNLGAYRYSGDYFSSNPNPLVHTWSLSVEEQIYIFLPILLILLLHNRRNIKRISTTIFFIITIFSCLSFLYPQILQPIYSKIVTHYSDAPFGFYSPIDRIWEFTLGSLCYILLSTARIKLRKLPKPLNLVLILILLLILFIPIEINLKPASILVTLITFLVITFRSLELVPNFIARKLNWLGDRSYSIYLFHMPLLYLAKYSPLLAIGHDESRKVSSVIAIVASIYLGSVVYTKIETRFRYRNKNISTTRQTPRRLLPITIILPLLIFQMINLGSKSYYWNLENNISQPQYAGFLDRNCLRDSETGPPCEYRIVGAKNTVLLVGDSHAGHISQAIVDASRVEKWNAVVWTHSGCPIVFRNEDSTQVSENCLKMNLTMKTWVAKNKPDIIVVSYYIRKNYSQQILQEALSSLKGEVAKIVLVENNPIFPDGNNFMVRRPILMTKYSPPPKFDISRMDYSNQYASDTLAKWAAQERISTLSLNKAFCDEASCLRFLDGDWLYRDVDHFSIRGAQRTIPYFRKLLVTP